MNNVVATCAYQAHTHAFALHSPSSTSIFDFEFTALGPEELEGVVAAVGSCKVHCRDTSLVDRGHLSAHLNECSHLSLRCCTRWYQLTY